MDDLEQPTDHIDIPQDRQEAISRSVILSRQFVHQMHQDATQDYSAAHKHLAEAMGTSDSWDATDVALHEEVVAMTNACVDASCIRASVSSPEELRNEFLPLASLAQQSSSDRGGHGAPGESAIACALTGEGLLRFAWTGDLQKEAWRLKKWEDALLHPSRAAEICGDESLLRVTGTATENLREPTAKFYELDDAFRGIKRNGTQIRIRSKPVVSDERSTSLRREGRPRRTPAAVHGSTSSSTAPPPQAPSPPPSPWPDPMSLLVLAGADRRTLTQSQQGYLSLLRALAPSATVTPLPRTTRDISVTYRRHPLPSSSHEYSADRSPTQHTDNHRTPTLNTVDTSAISRPSWARPVMRIPVAIEYR